MVKVHCRPYDSNSVTHRWTGTYTGRLICPGRYIPCIIIHVSGAYQMSHIGIVTKQTSACNLAHHRRRRHTSKYTQTTQQLLDRVLSSGFKYLRVPSRSRQPIRKGADACLNCVRSACKCMRNRRFQEDGDREWPAISVNGMESFERDGSR